MKRVLSRLLLVLGALLAVCLLLSLVEVGLWIAGVEPSPVPRPIRLRTMTGPEHDLGTVVFDPDLIFRLPPSYDFLGYYRSNAAGYRGPDANPRPAPGVYRIATVGDSCTFGLGVLEQEVYGAQLERMLDAAFEGVLDVEVLNFGVTAYSSFQNRQQIVGDVAAAEPDLVVMLTSYRNDAGRDEVATDAQRSRHYHSLQFALSRWRLAGLLGVSNRLARPAPREAPPAGVEPSRVGADEAVELVLEGLRASRAQGADFAYVAYVSTPPVYEQVPTLARREQLVLDALTAEDVPVADPRGDFARLAPRHAHVDPVHANETGHRFIAGSLLRLLVQTDLLPASPRREFLRWWLDVREQGVAPREALPDGIAIADLEGRDLPPGLRQLLAEPGDAGGDVAGAPGPYAAGELLLRALTSAPSTESSPVTERSSITEPSSVTESSPATSAAATGAAATGAPATSAAATGWAKRAAQVDAVVHPADPLRRYLWGARMPHPVADEQVRLARALAAFDREVLELSPDPIDRRIPQALTLLDAGDDTGALALLDDVLALNADDPEAIYWRLRALQRVRRHAAANVELDRLIVFEPDSPRVLALRGRRAYRSERYDEAIGYLRAAIEGNPVEIEAHYVLGRSLLAQGDLDGAERSLRTAASIAHRAYPDIPQLLAEIEAQRAAAP